MSDKTVKHEVTYRYVLDGDTAVFRMNGEDVTVRFLAVDTPEIDEEGYDWIYRDYGVQPASEAERRKAPVSLGSCAVAQKAQGK